MKSVLSLLLFSTTFASFAQTTDEKKLRQNIARLDSQTKAMDESMETNMPSMDSVEMARATEQMNGNPDSFRAARKEEQRKQWRGAYLRLGFDILLLILLIVGWVRKKKK